MFPLLALQLFVWLFARPAAWRDYVRKIDPKLSPYFGLLDLERRHLRNPHIQQFLLITLIGWPLTALIITYLILQLANVETIAIQKGVVFCLGFGLLYTVVLSSISSAATAAASGFVGIITAGVATGFAFNGFIDYFPLEDARFGAAFSETLAYGTVAGTTIASGINANLQRSLSQERSRSLPLQITGVAVTMCLLAAMYVGTLSVTATLAESRDLGAPYGLVFAGLFGLMNSLIVGLVVYLIKGRRHVSLLAVALWFTLALTTGAITGWGFDINRAAYQSGLGTSSLIYFWGMGMTIGTGNSILSLGGFALGLRIGNQHTGAIASSLAGSVTYFLLVLSDGYYSGSPHWQFAVAYLILSLTLTSWRPYVFIPFTYFWNSALYLLDQRRTNNRYLLEWHSAFWDSYTPIRLRGLDQHLLFVLEQNREQGLAALDALRDTAHQWVVYQVESQLLIQQLGDCDSAETIGRIHQNPRIKQYDLPHPIDTWRDQLQRFSLDIHNSLAIDSIYRRRIALSRLLEQSIQFVSHPLRPQFNQIADQWKEIIRDRYNALLTSKQQEIPNPYVVGNPLIEDERLFVGREDVGRHLEDILYKTQAPSIFLYGQRRMGKTSLLKNLRRLLPISHITPIFLDGQVLRLVSTFSEFIDTLAHYITEELREKYRIDLTHLQSIKTTSILGFQRWLDQVVLKLREKNRQTILLIFDELEALDQINVLTEVQHLLRHLIQHRPNIHLLVASSHPLEHYRHWSSYFINMHTVKLSYLKEKHALQLIQSPIDMFPLKFEPQALQNILHLTKGHPNLTQLLCYVLIERKNGQPTKQRFTVTTADVEQAIPSIYERQKFNFYELIRIVEGWGQCEARLLNLIAQEEAGITKQAIEMQFHENVTAIIETLLRYDFIEPTEKGYRFQVELIRRWFLMQKQ